MAFLTKPLSRLTTLYFLTICIGHDTPLEGTHEQMIHLLIKKALFTRRIFYHSKQGCKPSVIANLLLWSFCYGSSGLQGPSVEGGLLVWSSGGPESHLTVNSATGTRMFCTTPEGHHNRRPPHHEGTTPDRAISLTSLAITEGGAWWRP